MTSIIIFNNNRGILLLLIFSRLKIKSKLNIHNLFLTKQIKIFYTIRLLLKKKILFLLLLLVFILFIIIIDSYFAYASRTKILIFVLSFELFKEFFALFAFISVNLGGGGGVRGGEKFYLDRVGRCLEIKRNEKPAFHGFVFFLLIERAT